jgi:hypothetical protein
MLILFLFLCFQSGGQTGEQNDASSVASSCAEVFSRALSLNESFKNAVSAGGQRVFGLEAEKYFNAVLMKEISGCAAHASTHSDAVLAKLLFELAYSYSNSADEVIPRELARLYSNDTDLTKTILLDYDRSKRHELIGILNLGLGTLYGGKAEEASWLKKLTQLLEQLDSK